MILISDYLEGTVVESTWKMRSIMKPGGLVPETLQVLQCAPLDRRLQSSLAFSERAFRCVGFCILTVDTADHPRTEWMKPCSFSDGRKCSGGPGRQSSLSDYA